MNNHKHAFGVALLVLALFVTYPGSGYADEAAVHRNTGYYLGNVVNTGLDNGYDGADPITIDDPHFGWQLGRFYVTGYTSKKGDDDNPIFLKNVGDQIVLRFNLGQDIDTLNGDSTLLISPDTNGYDEYFDVPKTDFGRGTLIIRYTDSENSTSDPIIYTSYLDEMEADADTEVYLCEEGDYEVALDYEVQSPGFLNNPIWHTYNNYRIFFKFRVRNSNTMAFLFDSETGNELFNGSVTPSGFRLDLAGSRYLDVAIKRELMNETANGLVEDTRFNRAAADGDVFTDEGIYTVTISNPSTGEEPTVKRIYVGSDEVLMASVANSLEIVEVQNQLERGAHVAEDGTLVLASMEVTSPEHESAIEEAEDGSAAAVAGGVNRSTPVIPIAVAIIAVVGAAAGVILARKKKSNVTPTAEPSVGKRIDSSVARIEEDGADDLEEVDFS